MQKSYIILLCKTFFLQVSS